MSKHGDLDPNESIQSQGGKSERTKELRSVTPIGFTRAFFAANSWGAISQTNADVLAPAGGSASPTQPLTQ